ncbi:hypothetical protein EON65_50400 [archaeon]|nr:MAG: hypothetical protein EON65_50400 [archaeon]
MKTIVFVENQLCPTITEYSAIVSLVGEAVSRPDVVVSIDNGDDYTNDTADQTDTAPLLTEEAISRRPFVLPHSLTTRERAYRMIFLAGKQLSTWFIIFRLHALYALCISTLMVLSIAVSEKLSFSSF